MSAHELNLFPTFASLDFSAPTPLLKELDSAGRQAAAAFDDVLSHAGVNVADPYQADPATLRRAVQAFERALWDETGVPRAVRRVLSRNMTRAWDRVTRDARIGQLSAAVLLLEADARNQADQDDAPADAERHPITAYLDDTGGKAASKAFAAHAGALEQGKSRAEADGAARDAMFEALLGELSEDAIGWVKQLDDKGFWVVAAAGAAGVLASFVAAPRALLAAASALGFDPLPISHDFDVANIAGKVKVRIGAKVVALTGVLSEAESWTRVFREGFGAGASLSLDFGTASLTARAQVASEGWGMRFEFSGAFG